MSAKRAPGYGRQAYAAGHLPGARFADMDHDLCGPVAPGTGRHPLPAWADFTAWLGRQGISPGTTVVAYDDSHGGFAARLWWMLRALGHPRSAVLDGGFARWQREGHRVGTDRPTPVPVPYAAQPDPLRVASLEEVQRRLTDPAMLLVDARAAARYRGEQEPIDPHAGHIPGAINVPFMENVDANGVFLPPDQLRSRLLAAYGGHAPEATVHYCGSGVTACHTLLAQEAAALPPGRLYPGSWSQWCADTTRPFATGAATERPHARQAARP